MSVREDDLSVFRLALLTADRTRGEQTALQHFAERLETRWNARTITNMRFLLTRGAVDLVAEMLDSEMEPPIRKQAEKWAAKVEQTARRKRYFEPLPPEAARWANVPISTIATNGGQL